MDELETAGPRIYISAPFAEYVSDRRDIKVEYRMRDINGRWYEFTRVTYKNTGVVVVTAHNFSSSVPIHTFR